MKRGQQQQQQLGPHTEMEALAAEGQDRAGWWGLPPGHHQVAPAASARVHLTEGRLDMPEPSVLVGDENAELDMVDAAVVMALRMCWSDGLRWSTKRFRHEPPSASVCRYALLMHCLGGSSRLSLGAGDFSYNQPTGGGPPHPVCVGVCHRHRLSASLKWCAQMAGAHCDAACDPLCSLASARALRHPLGRMRRRALSAEPSTAFTGHAQPTSTRGAYRVRSSPDHEGGGG